MDGLSSFREIWLCDFEFFAPPGERPNPICMVARELRTRQTQRLWRDEFGRLPPFTLGPDALFIAYYASAELGCFLALDWPAPTRILDLYPEFRCLTSGLTVPCGNSLLGALSWYGLDGLAAVEKDTMRQLAQRGGPYTAEERRALLDYCQADVDAMARLLPAMLPHLDLPRALLRGRYMAAVARMERTGIPIDTEALNNLRANWTGIQDRLIERIDAGRGIYSGRTFKAERFAAWLVEQGIPWPRLASGALDLSDDCFHEMGRAYPDKVSPIRELRTALSQLRLESVALGSDGRNRCLLSPFGSRTGRNQPSNASYIFGPSTWLRGLIRPKEGMALAHIDWEQQEFGVAAALSGDRAMQEAYRSADPYLSFAKQAGAVPFDGDREKYKAQRERFKVLSLAVQYGMGPEALARKLDEPPARGRDLIAMHRRTYPAYWRWSDAVEMTAFLAGKLETAFGWTVHVGPTANPRSLRNFPLQANGAEMLRLACCLATERGIRVCGPVHDALLIEAPDGNIAEALAETQRAMREASKIVLAGFPLRTDAKIVCWPDRYSDPRGERFWRVVWELIGEGTPITRDTPTPITRDTQPLSPVIPPSCLLFSSVLVSSNEEGPHGGPAKIPVAAGDDGTAKAETETATALQGEISPGACSLGLAVAGNDAAGPGPGRGIGSLAGSRHPKHLDLALAACAPPGVRDKPTSRQTGFAGTGDSRPGDNPPAGGVLLGGNHSRRTDAWAKRQAEVDDGDLADMEDEREAIRAEGCTLHTPVELEELARQLVFP